MQAAAGIAATGRVLYSASLFCFPVPICSGLESLLALAVCGMFYLMQRNTLTTSSCVQSVHCSPFMHQLKGTCTAALIVTVSMVIGDVLKLAV